MNFNQTGMRSHHGGGGHPSRGHGGHTNWHQHGGGHPNWGHGGNWSHQGGNYPGGGFALGTLTGLALGAAATPAPYPVPTPYPYSYPYPSPYPYPYITPYYPGY